MIHSKRIRFDRALNLIGLREDMAAFVQHQNGVLKHLGCTLQQRLHLLSCLRGLAQALRPIVQPVKQALHKVEHRARSLRLRQNTHVKSRQRVLLRAADAEKQRFTVFLNGKRIQLILAAHDDARASFSCAAFKQERASDRLLRRAYAVLQGWIAISQFVSDELFLNHVDLLPSYIV